MFCQLHSALAEHMHQIGISITRHTFYTGFWRHIGQISMDVNRHHRHIFQNSNPVKTKLMAIQHNPVKIKTHG